MLLELTTDEMMDRMARISDRQGCGVRVRPDLPPGPGKWYVHLGKVVAGSIETGGLYSSIALNCDSGVTPEDAIRNTWQAILALEKSEKIAIVRYNCPSDVPIPGNDPQVWVNWNSEIDDWEDVVIERLPSHKLRPYKDQLWRDKA